MLEMYKKLNLTKDDKASMLIGFASYTAFMGMMLLLREILPAVLGV